MSEPIILLIGGRSTEHDASLHSYYRVMPEVSKATEQLTITAVVHVDGLSGARVFTRPPWPSTEAEILSHEAITLSEAIGLMKANGAFIFSLLHGTEGEDGCWQGLAEVLDLPGSFGPTLASAAGMDKRMAGLLAREAVPGLRIPRTTAVRARYRDTDLDAAFDQFADCSVVVKPNRMGASLLTSVLPVYDREEIARLTREIHQFDCLALIQEYVAGKEVSCGVIADNGAPLALPVLAIATPDGFFDHNHKHHGDAAKIGIDTSAHTAFIQQASEQIFEDLGVFGWARLDYILTEQGVYFLEINTIPGLMHGSLFPRMLAASGRDIAALITACTRVCTDAHRGKRKNLRYTIGH